ncbi:uncharacterized protein [Watersipora subatra]|uniref:uncharacterized protein isoform X4 n=1 Tax=Watersipora subatra TaxID=2589382 RepID=UPI00355B2AA5
MARTKGRVSPSAIGPVRLYPLIVSILVALIINIKPAYGAKEKELFVSASCLSSLDDIVIRCSKPNEKINIRSASYANAEDCSNPPVDNDCVQPSMTLANEAQVNCNGLRQCTINVKSIDTFNSEQQLTYGIDSEEITYSMDTCTVNGYLQQSVPMNLYQVKYECHELSVCNELSDEVIDLTIATDKYPEKSVTNPTCECTYSSSETEYHLNGYTRCNGTVMFITEEFYTNGESEQLEYKCIDEVGGDYMTLGGHNANDPTAGSKEPHTIKVRIDVERSDEESSYEIHWFNIRGNSKTRKTQTIVKVDCVGGKLYLKGSVQVILKIVLPIVGVLLIILIILYCVISKRRRRAKDWRASHVRLNTSRNAGMVEMSMHGSRASSMDSFAHRKQQRVDPEGTVDDVGELAAMLNKQNEERKRAQLEKRQAAREQRPPGFGAPMAISAPPSMHSMQPTRRTQSIGNLRSNRQYTYGDNMDNLPDPKPLVYTKSASQSRASMRSLKRRAPPPPQEPSSLNTAPRPGRPSRASSTPSVHKMKSRNASQPVVYAQPSQYYPPTAAQVSSHYAASQVAASPQPGSAAYPDAEPSYSDDEDMPIMRPGSRTKPPVAPKPALPPKHSRVARSNSRKNITPAELGELQKEELY